jgi:hypothetical protein
MSLLPQAQVWLRIVIPEEKCWLDTEAVVVWENRGSTSRNQLPSGYGLRFIKLTAETERRLRRLLQPPAPARSRSAPPGRQSESAPTVHSLLQEQEHSGPPYRLEERTIRAEIGDSVPGVFVLSYDRAQGARVGRADENLYETLSAFVGEYAYFYFEVIEDLEARFYRECELFHRLGGDHGQLDNAAHPTLLPVGELACPICVD